MTSSNISFAPGKITYTIEAREALQRLGISGLVLLRRHISGDWGEADPKRSQINTLVVSKKGSLKKEMGVISRYLLGDGVVIKISTQYLDTPSKRETHITLAEATTAPSSSLQSKGTPEKKSVNPNHQLPTPKAKPGSRAGQAGRSLTKKVSH